MRIDQNLERNVDRTTSLFSDGSRCCQASVLPSTKVPKGRGVTGRYLERVGEYNVSCSGCGVSTVSHTPGRLVGSPSTSNWNVPLRPSVTPVVGNRSR